ncbi:Calnexin (ISS) [Corchorus olitorius]|uniref:Calnexin (ISS) n=1 Tax=Corchorus olitorius TaxID=93759 RepID=A0A1R3L332_9ROSI|nr:Calnexin (ISS) [Corchorus olitorius]
MASPACWFSTASVSASNWRARRPPCLCCWSASAPMHAIPRWKCCTRPRSCNAVSSGSASPSVRWKTKMRCPAWNRWRAARPWPPSRRWPSTWNCAGRGAGGHHALAGRFALHHARDVEAVLHRVLAQGLDDGMLAGCDPERLAGMQDDVTGGRIGLAQQAVVDGHPGTARCDAQRHRHARTEAVGLAGSQSIDIQARRTVTDGGLLKIQNIAMAGGSLAPACPPGWRPMAAFPTARASDSKARPRAAWARNMSSRAPATALQADATGTSCKPSSVHRNDTLPVRPEASQGSSTACCPAAIRSVSPLRRKMSPSLAAGPDTVSQMPPWTISSVPARRGRNPMAWPRARPHAPAGTHHCCESGKLDTSMARSPLPSSCCLARSFFCDSHPGPMKTRP